MVRLEIINLFPKQYRPQILAYDFITSRLSVKRGLSRENLSQFHH